ncbi:MAG: hypothetical protein OEM52_13770 [bacterium]|nr:hypothetical protein [bacterium]
MTRKLLLIALAISLLIASVAGATVTRVMTLGNVNHIIKDKANMSLYPQAINYYPMWGSMDLRGSGANSLYSVGGHYKFGSAIYGMYVGTDGIPEGGYYGPVVGETGATDMSTAPKLNMYYGRMLGDMPFGFNLMLFQNSWTDKTAGSSAEKSQMYLGLGFGLTLQEKIDLGLNLRTHSFTEKNAAGTDVAKPNGGLKLDLNARYWYEWDAATKTYFVPYFGFAMESQGVDSNSVGKYSMSSTNIMLGCGFNTSVTPTTMFVGDFGIGIGSGEQKIEPVGGASVTAKTTANQLPYYRMGFETQVFEWMVARVGAERKWISAGTDKTDEWATSTTNLYLGAGMKRGEFLLDLNVDPGIVNRGPYFLTGSGGNWSTMASIRWMPSK